MSEEERSRLLQEMFVRASSINKPELPTLASTPEPVSLYSYLSPSPCYSSLHVHVEGVPFQYTLTETDLNSVFSRYGQVRLVHVNLDGSSAVIYFHSPADAVRALHELDNKLLSGIQGRLRLKPIPAAVPGSDLPFRPCASPHVLAAEDCAVRKYTCRFEIGIENDREFYVARRLIGPKGAQMKRILMACEGPETPKLRLRGIGSGFLEGALKQESPEPLHLCISCKDYGNYRKAVDMVIDLLNHIYHEYAAFCRDHPSLQFADRPMPAISCRETPLVNMLQHPTATSSPDRFTPHVSPRAGWAVQLAGGLSFPSAAPTEEDVNEEILRLVEERNGHRARGNFEEADRIRQVLKSRGVGLMDEPGGRGRAADVTSMRMWSRMG